MARTIKCPLEVGKKYAWIVQGKEYGVYTCNEYKKLELVGGTGEQTFAKMDIDWERDDIEVSHFYSAKSLDGTYRVIRKDILAAKVKRGHFKPC
jgi:hypothetical protein